ncbi:MAG: hypothetical protein K2O91_17025 [Lachnospiraceae bacterium]|nr:hypothetical protein [Lachnospiraceae bacterium]
MISRLKELIASYITEYSKTDRWDDIRYYYAVYSYISFLVLAISNMGLPLGKLKKTAVDVGLDAPEVVEYILNIREAVPFITDLISIINKANMEDINVLYQDFLTVDYTMKNGIFVFGGGKNNRDTLGSYYTQEDFALEIVKRAVDEYLKDQNMSVSRIKIADFSCGGGAFLVAALKYCAEKGIQAELFGCDVDPVAVMITRARLYKETNSGSQTNQVLLGNPLLGGKNAVNCIEKFNLAMYGRYYNAGMGLDIDTKYDIIIGNPPWEKIRFEEKKFLSHYFDTDVIETKQNRENALKSVSESNRLFYNFMQKDYETVKKQIKTDKFFESTNCGELNTYALFTEYAVNMLDKDGIVGLIVKSSLLKMPVYSSFMKMVTTSKKLSEIYMFVNRNRLFNIDSREEFSVIYLKEKNNEQMKIAVNLDEYTDFHNKEKISLSKDMIDLLNPDTGMLPNVHNNRELEFLCRIYSKNKVFGEEYRDCHFGRLVHLTNHSRDIVKDARDGFLPVYEGKFIELYTGKYATFKGMTFLEKYKSKAAARQIDNIDGEEYPESRYFINQNAWYTISKNFSSQYIVAWRSLTSATNRRTMLATILPLLPTCQSIQMLQVNDFKHMLHILTLFNSVVFDYIVRLKMAGLDLTQTIIKQIPVPPEQTYKEKKVFCGIEATVDQHINSRLRSLYKNDYRVYKIIDEQEHYMLDENMDRKKIIAELDVLVGMQYGLGKREVKEIAGTFDKYYCKNELENWF